MMFRLSLYQRYLIRETFASVFLVLAAFLALFAFFNFIDELRSVGKAATLLHVTQPAVSKTLAEIQADLGMTLFKRTPRGVEPTELGACWTNCHRVGRGSSPVAATVRHCTSA